MKFCNTCGTEKAESEFHIRKASVDGLCAKCKSCMTDYDKKRSGDKNRVAKRKEYSLSIVGIAAGKKAKEKYIEKNPTKRKAHILVGNAIRDKKLFKEPCEVCFTEENICAHHDDYAKPLNVRWLCALHHSQWHQEHGESLNP
jgi:hypothetical protein